MGRDGGGYTPAPHQAWIAYECRRTCRLRGLVFRPVSEGRMMAEDIETRASAEFEALKRLSARVGADPLLVQAAGGNTSIKDNGVLWIKASGTWLMNAESEDIFVPVRIAPLLEAVADLDPVAEQAETFTVTELNPSGLRPSIETTVHALMPQRVVVHVHCVETIAFAV